MALNRTTIIGNLGKDPELKYTPSGVAVSNFPVAVTDRYKDTNTNELKETTEWFNVVAWNKQAELCAKYLVKGAKVYIDGKSKTRSWEKDGQKHYATDLVLQSVEFLSKKVDGERRNEGGNTIPNNKNEVVKNDQNFDSIPF